ncbi:MAG: anthranilate phosphoribosyltransferase, partial [Pseudomonadales bacterium]|nr:anthranilate phosphoribosyltransferase [Pseudomonadales bacterium]
MDMPEAIARVVARQNLNRDEMLEVMRLIMSGQATDAQIGGFLVGLRMKGEIVEEITAAAMVMRELVTPVEVSPEYLVDTCGTGGSGIAKFNISTASAFVAAAAGVRVAKHGNRAASGKSGSADVLEAAGANIMLSPQEVARCIESTGVGFLFAVSHHTAMKYAIGPRREMVTRTLFNVLGPLTNPARARRQVLGVYDPGLIRPIAEVLQALGSEHVMVLHSDDGLDEISIGAETRVAELKEGQITEYKIDPAAYGITDGSIDDLLIGDAAGSLEMVRAALTVKNRSASAIVAL